MKEEKVYCPYCGPWNGHPVGVEMEKYIRPNSPFNPTGFVYRCDECGSISPFANTEKEAHTAALHRFNPAAAEICDLINQIAYCDYECVAGPLGHNQAFIRLRDLVFDSCGDLGAERSNQ